MINPVLRRFNCSSTTELAKLLEVSPRTLTRWSRGTHPIPRTVVMLSLLWEKADEATRKSLTKKVADTLEGMAFDEDGSFL